MWQKLSKSYPPQLELIPLFLLGLCFYLTLSYYPSLPDRIPSHFNLQGLPDAWGGKGSLLIYPLLGAFIYILLTIMNILLAVMKDPRGLINLPQKRKTALTAAQVEELRIFLNRCLFALKTLLLGLFTYSLYATVEVALGRAPGLGTPFFLSLLGIMALAGYMVWKSFSLTQTSPLGK